MSSVDKPRSSLLVDLVRKLGPDLFVHRTRSRCVKHISNRSPVMYLGRSWNWRTGETLPRGAAASLHRALIAAVPAMHRHTPPRRDAPPGRRHPKRLHPPPGCRFSPAVVGDRLCRTSEPATTNGNPAISSACHVEAEATQIVSLVTHVSSRRLPCRNDFPDDFPFPTYEWLHEPLPNRHLNIVPDCRIGLRGPSPLTREASNVIAGYEFLSESRHQSGRRLKN